MFGQVLVTPTLLDSFEFAVNAPPNWKAKAMKNFVSSIKREKIEYPDWVKKGRDFEDAIYKVCKRAGSLQQAMRPGSEKFKEIVAHVYGGAFQNKLQKALTIGQHRAFYFGYSDVELDGLTIDIKTTIMWKGQQKYLNKNQHKVYLWINGNSQFEYIVTEWKDNGKSNEIKSNHIIKYISPGADQLEKEIVGRTQAMFDFIQSEGLWEDYYFTFSKN